MELTTFTEIADIASDTILGINSRTLNFTFGTPVLFKNAICDIVELTFPVLVPKSVQTHLAHCVG